MGTRSWVAIKQLPIESDQDLSKVEAEALEHVNKLQVPGVVQLVDCFRAPDGHQYLVQE